MKVFLLPYKQGSNGAKVLAKNLGIKRIKLENSKFIPSNNKLVINWGNSTPSMAQQNWLNEPRAVKIASRKDVALDVMCREGVPIIEYTGNKTIALGWVEGDGLCIARNVLRGHSGEGIEIIKDIGALRECDACLYTRYFKAKDEYRVHVMQGAVIDVQQKRKRDDVAKEDANYKIRSHENGFNFCREGVELPPCCADASIAAVVALGLDFGAVDIRFNAKTGKCAVMEVNTAPGLEGTTIDIYSKAFMELFQNFDVKA